MGFVFTASATRRVAPSQAISTHPSVTTAHKASRSSVETIKPLTEKNRLFIKTLFNNIAK